MNPKTRYVIVRDDDTNASTPIDCLERLYRPFLDRRLPVNLAVIPDVSTGTRLPDGGKEGYLFATNGHAAQSLPIGDNLKLVEYLKQNPGYHIVQHGCHHDRFEFARKSFAEISNRLDNGARFLAAAGFRPPQTFVAPYDRISRAGFRAISSRFRVLSTGWFEWRQLPPAWWPRYLLKKIRRAPHWRAGQTLLLSHPGCLLSFHHDLDAMLQSVIQNVQSRLLTVLVTHWWEYFRDQPANEAFIQVLHETARYLAATPGVEVISFDDLIHRRIGFV